MSSEKRPLSPAGHARNAWRDAAWGDVAKGKFSAIPPAQRAYGHALTQLRPPSGWAGETWTVHATWSDIMRGAGAKKVDQAKTAIADLEASGWLVVEQMPGGGGPSRPGVFTLSIPADPMVWVTSKERLIAMEKSAERTARIRSSLPAHGKTEVLESSRTREDSESGVFPHTGSNFPHTGRLDPHTGRLCDETAGQTTYATGTGTGSRYGRNNPVKEDGPVGGAPAPSVVDLESASSVGEALRAARIPPGGHPVPRPPGAVSETDPTAWSPTAVKDKTEPSTLDPHRPAAGTDWPIPAARSEHPALDQVTDGMRRPIAEGRPA